MAAVVVNTHQHRPHASWIKAIHLDDHSLALFRISLGLLALINVLVRANYPEFLAGSEAIDLSAAVNRHQVGAWSLHWLVGSNTCAQLALLDLMGLCVLGVAVGYRTPISTILLLMFTVSLHNSNPLIINGGDRQLVTALLWACLLPVGRVWSVDQLLRPAEATASRPVPDHSPTSNWARLGYVAQIVLLYWMAASHKSLQGWLIEGSAVWFAFHIDIFSWPAARQLLAFPALLQLFSRGAYLIQWAAPLLLIWPSRSITPRLVGIGLLASMHLGFLPVLKLGLFPWVSLVCLLPLLPGQLWQRWLRPQPQSTALPTIFYDQDCRFCRDAATILTRLLRLEGCPLLPSQSDESVASVMRQANSWVVQTAAGQRSVEFAAFLQLCAASPWAHHLGGPLTAITPLGTRLYRLVSHHRRSAQRLLNALRGTPIHVGIRLQQACAATVIGLMLVAAWHANLAERSSAFRQATASFGNQLQHLGLQQRWSVFAPRPMANDGWFELNLQPNDGPQQRLLVPSLTPASGSTNPLRSQPLYRSQRQRKFFHNLQQPEHTQAAEAYTRHACRQLAATPGFTPGELELVWMQETTQPPPLPPAPVQSVSRLRQRCG